MLQFIISLVLLSNTNSQINYGQCINNDNCLSLGPDYICVSVQTNVADLVQTSKCIQGSVCVGNNFGSCPDFLNWDIKYQVLRPECSFSFVRNCKNTNEATDSVDCYNSTNDNTVYGIYKCIDANTILVTESPDTNITRINSTITDITITNIPITAIPISNNTTSNKFISVFICIALNLIVINHI